VARPDFPLTILEFQQRFGTEEACREYLFCSRWPEGFVCPGCDARNAGGETRRHLWICTACGRQTSITAGTVMHKTRLPLRTWFWAAYLVSTFHPGISAKQLQRQLGIGCHETAWAMLHKFRAAMVAPEREMLKREVEIDEFFLGGHEQGLRGGRQHGKKVLVGAAIEVRGRGSGRLRLQALPNSQAATLEAFTKATTAKGSIVHTDGLFSYNGLQNLGYDHRPRKVANVADRGATAAAGAPRDLESQGLDARHPPRRLCRAPPRLPRRVRLSPQPPRHPDGRLPDATWTRARPRPRHLPPDHRFRRLTATWS
jgi:transposase-like protein